MKKWGGALQERGRIHTKEVVWIRVAKRRDTHLGVMKEEAAREMHCPESFTGYEKILDF